MGDRAVGSAVHRVLGEPERFREELDRLPRVVVDEDGTKALHVPRLSHAATVRGRESAQVPR